MTTTDKKWIKSFFENFFDETVDDKKLVKCLNFKNEKMPSQLYQYTKAKYAKGLISDNLMFLRKN